MGTGSWGGLFGHSVLLLSLVRLCPTMKLGVSLLTHGINATVDAYPAIG